MPAPVRQFRVVRTIEDPPPAPAPERPDSLLTMDEVAARLRMSRSTVYALARKGTIPVVRFGGSKLVRVSERQLDAFVAGQGAR